MDALAKDKRRVRSQHSNGKKGAACSAVCAMLESRSSSVWRCSLLFIGIDACLVARAAAVTIVTEWPRFTVRLVLSTLCVGKSPAITKRHRHQQNAFLSSLSVNDRPCLRVRSVLLFVWGAR